MTGRSRKLSHLDDRGRCRMVDVGGKAVTDREATAAGAVFMQNETLILIREGQISKGEVLAVARVAGILAAKNTPHTLPLCHPIGLTGIEVRLNIPDDPPSRIEIQAKVRTQDRTGVEMEALAAVSAAALTIYDMCKAVDRGMTISDIRLLEKQGGQSGHYVRAKDPKYQPTDAAKGDIVRTKKRETIKKGGNSLSRK